MTQQRPACQYAFLVYCRLHVRGCVYVRGGLLGIAGGMHKHTRTQKSIKNCS